MAGKGFTLNISAQAGADLSTYQYCAIRLDETSGKAKLSNATSQSIGILTNTPSSGQAASIDVLGEAKAYVSGTVTVMDRLAPIDTYGTLAVTTTDNDAAIAVALESYASDTPGVKRVFLLGPHRY